MLKEEFLKITGLKEISDEDYAEIESVYDNVNASKLNFLNAWYGVGDDSLIKMRMYCKELSDKLTFCRNEKKEHDNAAENLAQRIILGDDAETAAYAVLGTIEAVKLKIVNNKPLTKFDKQIILDNID